MTVFIIGIFLMGIIAGSAYLAESQQLKRDARCALGHGSPYSRQEWEKALIQARADIEKEKIK